MEILVDSKKISDLAEAVFKALGLELPSPTFFLETAFQQNAHRAPKILSF